jgi:hypothetical protein
MGEEPKPFVIRHLKFLIYHFPDSIPDCAKRDMINEKFQMTYDKWFSLFPFHSTLLPNNSHEPANSSVQALLFSIREEKVGTTHCADWGRMNPVLMHSS